MDYTIKNLQNMFLKKGWIYVIIFMFTSTIYSQIIWQENINCTVVGSHLSDMATGSSVLSQNSLAPTNANGWVEIDNIAGVGTKTLHRFGLFPTANLASLDWTSGYYFSVIGSLSGTSLSAYDHATNLGSISFNPLTDVLKIEKISNTIYYKKNGVTVFQVTETTQALADYKIVVNTAKGLNISHDISTSLAEGTTSGGGGAGDATVTLETSDDKNWIASTTFDIDGNITSNGLSYFDALGKGIQTQSLDIKTGNVWATETLYDVQGRPAFQTLSSPINDTGSFLFKTDFIKKTNGLPYTETDFEGNPESPEAIGSQVNSLGWYYSESNTNNPYQDITSYPFSRTIYSTLNPGSSLKTIGGNKVTVNGQSQWIGGFSYSVPGAQEMYYAYGVAYYDGAVTTEGEEVITKIVKSVAIDVHGEETVVFTDTEGKTLAAARSNGPIKYEVVSVIGEQGYVDVHIPKGIVNSDIQWISTDTYTIYDLRTEQTVIASNLTGGNLYRISLSPQPEAKTYINGSVINTSAGAKGIRYKVNYYDFSLNYYDKAGRLKESVQPLGFDDSNLSGQSFNTPNHTMKSTFEYNSLNQLLTTSSPDEGTAQFKYRKDGQIRFSQNIKQELVNELSYTNYDELGRPVESGVVEGLYGGAWELYHPDTPNSFGGTRKEQHFTLYDITDITEIHAALTTEGIATSNYSSQNFMAGNVSKTYTVDPSTTTTWYSYDIYGRVEWLIQKIDGLGTKTIDYQYDPITGNVLKVLYQRDKASERFIHRYTYNVINQLTQVEISVDDINFSNQATYEYYETGALRRVELADNLQGIDYVYNLAGQLKAINHPSGDPNKDPSNDGTNGVNPDAFGMSIDYYNGDYLRTNTPTAVASVSDGINQYNGNIKATTWRTNTVSTPNTEAYYYDYNEKNWLKGASYSTPLIEGSATGVADFQQTWSWQDFVNTSIGGGNSVILTAVNNTVTFTYTASFISTTIKTGQVVQISYPVPDMDLGYISVRKSTGEVYTNVFSIAIVDNWLVVSATGAYPSYLYTYMTSLNNSYTVAPGTNTPVSSTGDYNVYDITYDRNGNIITLNRNKNTENASNAMDSFMYNYYPGTNQLENVDDTATAAVAVDDLKDQAPTNYQYNSIGQLISNTEENIEYVYNVSGLVTSVKKNGQSLVSFYYNDRGHRVKKRDWLNETDTYYVRDVAGSVMAIYNNTTLTELPIYGASRLGMFNKSNNTSKYEINDHLGNVRAVVETTNTLPTYATDYYPGGMSMPGRKTVGGVPYRYGYQGQFAEIDPETGKVAFQLRLYDPRINRWLSPDPMGQYFSPYMAMDNRPNMSVDPTGGCTVGVDCPEEFDWMGTGTFVADELVLGDLNAGVRYGSDALTSGGNINFRIGNVDFWDDVYGGTAFNVGSWESWTPNWKQKWGKSDNIIGTFSYDFVNGFFTTSQMFLGRSVGNYSMRNIDGTATTTDQGIMGFVGTASFGYGKYASSLKYLKPLKSSPSLWNIFQSSTKGVFNSRTAAADAYKIQIKSLNNMISNHNGLVKTLQQSDKAIGLTGDGSSVIDYFKND